MSWVLWLRSRKVQSIHLIFSMCVVSLTVSACLCAFLIPASVLWFNIKGSAGILALRMFWRGPKWNSWNPPTACKSSKKVQLNVSDLHGIPAWMLHFEWALNANFYLFECILIHAIKVGSMGNGRSKLVCFQQTVSTFSSQLGYAVLQLQRSYFSLNYSSIIVVQPSPAFTLDP